MGTLSSARLATSLAFAVHGAVAGTFATRIPQIQQSLELSEGQLGAALMAPAIGALIAMPLTSQLIHRFGLRPTIRVTLVAWCLSVTLPAVAFDLPSLFVALMIFGAAAGLGDVSINSSGVSLEKARNAPVMSSLHGYWGMGMLAGSGAGVVAAHVELDPMWHFVGAALVLALIGLTLPRYMLAIAPDVEEDKPPAFALPVRSTIPIGLVALCAVFIEGAAANWSAVYMIERVEASPGLAAASVPAFMLTMSLARLFGNPAIRRLGPVTAVRISAAFAAAGAVAVMLGNVPWVAIVGFMFMGVGVAIVVPLCYGAAGHVGTNQSRSIAGVATMTEGSNVIAPAIVGGIAVVASLTVSFGFMALLALLIIPAARALRVARPDSPADTLDSSPAPAPHT